MSKVDAEFGIKMENCTYTDREAVYGILIEDNKILVIQTPRGYFLPGGGTESTESHKECLQREMLEETGFEVEIVSYIGKSVFYDKSPKDNIYYNMYGNFYHIIKTSVKEKTETDHQPVWMNIDEAIQKLKLIHQVWAVKKLIP